MAQENTNKLYWLAYCDAIKQQVGQLGSSSAIFFGNKAQRGPPVNCDDAYLNYGVYNVADSLLAADNLFYSGSSDDSYIRNLQAYLNWVDVGGNPSDENKYALTEAINYYNACQANVLLEAENGSKEYGKLKSLELIDAKEKFADWLPLNYPAYNNAVNNRDGASGQVLSAQMAIAGERSAQWENDFSRISLAINTLLKPQADLNMPTTQEAPPSATEILNATISKQTLPPPTNVVYRPAYGAPDYVSTVKSWQSVAAKPPTKAKSVTLNLKNAKDISESSFGQESFGGNLGFSYEDIIGVRLDGSSEHTEKTVNTSNSENEIEITVYWDSMKAATVTPGPWNIGNPKSLYPTLKPGAPNNVRVLVRPTKLWLVQNLGYSVKFSGSMKNTFDKTVTDVKKAGGSLTFFGIPISLGANYSKETSDITHRGDYDASSGTLNIAPEPDVGFATIIAVVGEKVQTF